MKPTTETFTDLEIEISGASFTLKGVVAFKVNFHFRQFDFIWTDIELTEIVLPNGDSVVDCKDFFGFFMDQFGTLVETEVDKYLLTMSDSYFPDEKPNLIDLDGSVYEIPN